MITRLKVSGFKSLMDVDVLFGPFTCIAGANGTGKSNLFDAIHFLSALADRDLVDAARQIRYEGDKLPDIRSLFTHYGESYADTMSFEVELLVPSEGIDRLGQTGKAKTTFLTYKLELGYKEGEDFSLTRGGLKLLREELSYIRKSDAARHLRFNHHVSKWRASVLKGESRADFISTSTDGDKILIKAHQEGRQGRARQFLAETLPRTVLSESSASENPTVAVARYEMLSWRFLQLEPASLRRSSHFSDPTTLGTDGVYLPSTLYRLAESEGRDRVYAEIANRLSLLLDDVREVRIDRDDKRELLTLEVAGRDGAFHSAKSLSDGTLRFIALSVLEAGNDPGVLCLEEPENGIHPSRIEPMIELLSDIAMDAEEPADDANPLRQVIINTHSPSVVQQVPEDALLVADRKERIGHQGERYSSTEFLPLPNTWRVEKGQTTRWASMGKLLGYLNPVDKGEQNGSSRRRVIDRPDARQQLSFPFYEDEA